MRRHRNAKIIATLGPASSTPEIIRGLYEAEGAIVAMMC
jgi:pyruvate kinase